MDHALHLALLAVGFAAFVVAPPAVAVPIFLGVIAAAAATFVAVKRALRLPARTGNESLVGGAATVVEWTDGDGLVRHRGELWRATGPATLRPKTRVHITGAEGTLLEVRSDQPPRGSGA